MRIVVSALGTTLDDAVDERFGRAEQLLLIDTVALTVEVIDNSTNHNALKGAGIGAAEHASKAGAQAVLTGHLGPNAFRALQAAGIQGYGASSMTVREAVDRFVANELELLGEGESHAGM